jgi:hypothetical protein
LFSLLVILLAQLDAGTLAEHCQVRADTYFPDAGVGLVVWCDVPIYGHRFGATLDTHKALQFDEPGHAIPQFLSLESENGTPHSGVMPGRVLEIHGYESDEQPGHPWRSAVEIYCLGRGYTGAGHNKNTCVGIGATPSSAKIAYFTTGGDFVSETGGNFVLNSDDNEKRIVASSALGPASTARLQLKGFDPGNGPAVYVTSAAVDPVGPTFSVLNFGNSTGFHVGPKAEVTLGKIATNALPGCAESEGAIAYDSARKCFAGCDGTAWRCLLVATDGGL